MKRNSLIAWIAVGSLVFTTGSMAAGPQPLGPRPLDIQVIPHSKVGKASSSVITVTIRNVTKVPLYLPKALTPIFTPDHHLQNSLFDVIDSTGKRAEFIGRYVHVLGEGPDVYYLRLMPGQTVTHDLDLAVDYDLLKGGDFSVSYEQAYTNEVIVSPRGDIASDEFRMDSEVAHIWVESSAKPVALSSSRAAVNAFEVISDSPYSHEYPLRKGRLYSRL